MIVHTADLWEHGVLTQTLHPSTQFPATLSNLSPRKWLRSAMLDMK